MSLGMGLALCACLICSRWQIRRQNRTEVGEEKPCEDFRCGSLGTKNIDFLEGVWNIIEFPNIQLSDSSILATLELQLGQAKCYGYVECNRFYGSVQADEHGHISFDKLNVIHRVYPDHSVENLYLEALRQVRYYLLDRASGQMQLFDKEGKFVMRLEVLIAC